MKMKQKAGFTLIELLVVITIILILAGILLPAITGAMKQAQITKARQQATAIKTALVQYRTDYGKWPFATQKTTDWHYQGTDLETEILGVLMVDTDLVASATIDKINPRKTPYLEAPVDDAKQVHDPWDSDYYISIDANFDGKVKNTASGSKEHTVSVIVNSRGPDGTLEEPIQNTGSDDITTFDQ